MEGLRVSKLEEGQQWGKNTSSKDKVHWGRRPPFIGGEKSNRYAHSPHRAVLPLVLTVLKKYIRAYHRWTWDEFLVQSGSSQGSSRGSTASMGGSTAAALTKTATTFANGLRIQRNQVCWKANDMV